MGVNGYGVVKLFEYIRYASFFDVTWKDTSLTNKQTNQPLTPRRINTQSMGFISGKNDLWPKNWFEIAADFSLLLSIKLNIRGFGVLLHSTGSSCNKRGWSRLGYFKKFLIKGSSSQDKLAQGGSAIMFRLAGECWCYVWHVKVWCKYPRRWCVHHPGTPPYLSCSVYVLCLFP